MKRGGLSIAIITCIPTTTLLAKTLTESDSIMNLQITLKPTTKDSQAGPQAAFWTPAQICKDSNEDRD